MPEPDAAAAPAPEPTTPPAKPAELDPTAPLAQKIAAAMLEAKEVTKSSENKEQGYKFASAESILAAVREPLLQRGVIMLPAREATRETEIQSRGGTKGTKVAIDLTFTFSDGIDTIECTWTGEGQDYGDKAYGKAYTNAVKTFIRTGWMLPTEHDDPEGSDPGEAVSAMPAYANAASDELVASNFKVAAQIIGADRARSISAAIREKCDGAVPAIAAYAIGVLSTAVLESIDELAIKDAAERRAAAAAEPPPADAAPAADDDTAPPDDGDPDPATPPDDGPSDL